MPPSFPDTVSALAYSIIRERCEAQSRKDAFPHNRVARFVIGQHGRMPDYLRFPIRILTLAFDAWAVFRTGHLFHRLPHEQRLRQMEAWRHARLSPCRDFMKFYDNLVVFAWFSETYDSSPAELHHPTA